MREIPKYKIYTFQNFMHFAYCSLSGWEINRSIEQKDGKILCLVPINNKAMKIEEERVSSLIINSSYFKAILKK